MIIYLLFQYGLQIFIFGFFIVAFLMMMSSGKPTLLTNNSKYSKFSIVNFTRRFPKSSLLCDCVPFLLESCSGVLFPNVFVEYGKYNHFWENDYHISCLNLVLLKRKKYFRSKYSLLISTL